MLAARCDSRRHAPLWSDESHEKTWLPILRRGGLYSGLAGRASTARSSARAQEAPSYAGPTEKGFLLPNGWTLKPAGEHIPQADLPLNIIPLADNRHVLVATSGYNAHELSLIDLDQKKVVDRQAVRQSWFGLAVSPRGRPDLVVGGRRQRVHAFHLADGHLTRRDGTEPAAEAEGREGRGDRHFRGGLALDAGSQGALLAGRRRRHDLRGGPGDSEGTEVRPGRDAAL